MRPLRTTIERAPRSQRRARALGAWPALVGLLAVAAAELLSRVPDSHPALAVAWPGDSEGASTMVQVVATAAVTVITLTFSLTVVALQLASQQFSPRLLREFTRDAVTRVVLSVLVATFAFSITTLRHLDDREGPPALAATGTFVLGLLSVASVLGFITHLVRILRVDSAMQTVHGETRDAIEAFYPLRVSGDAPPADEPDGPEVVVPARHSGFVRVLDLDGLVAAAGELDVVLRMEVCPGDQLVRGTPLATSWGSAEPDAVAAAVHANIGLDFERTLEQDVAFGFRQLADIAIRALSPAINDPVTASHAVAHMADLLVRLTDRRLGVAAHADAQGRTRVLVHDRDLRYFLDLACGQVRHYAGGQPVVLDALLRLLRDLAVNAVDDAQRAEVRRQADLVLRETSRSLLDEDAAAVEAMHGRVLLALEGRSAEAYADRAGETRSV